MSDERFRLLVGAAIGTVAIVGVVVLLALRIPVEQIVTGYTVVGTVISLFILGEVQKVKQNTNGVMAEMWKRLDDLTEYVKHSQPIREEDDGRTSAQPVARYSRAKPSETVR